MSSCRFGAAASVLAALPAAACARTPSGPGEPVSRDATPPADASSASPDASRRAASPDGAAGDDAAGDDAAGDDAGHGDFDPLPLPSEPSVYGRFEMQVNPRSDCVLSFRESSGKRRPVTRVPDCGGEWPGIDVVGGVRRVGGVSLPIVTPHGDEFHLFEIASARGGNASAAFEYWAVVVRSGGVWATRSLSGADEVSVVHVEDGPPSKVIFEEPATTTEEGARFAVQFGQAEVTTLPKRPSWIVSRKKLVLVGQLQGGFHYTSWRPAVVADQTTILDEDGPCKLPALGVIDEDAPPSRVTVEVATWSDGRKTVKCLAVRR